MQQFGHLGSFRVATDRDSCTLGSGKEDIKTNIDIVVLLLQLRNEIILYTLLDILTAY